MKAYDILLFDADGTLFDYEMAEGYALEQTFWQYGLSYDDGQREQYRAINSAVWKVFEQGKLTAREMQALRFSRLFAKMGVDRDAEGFNQSYLETLGGSSFLINGAEALCRELHNAGKELYIITNGLKISQRARVVGSTISLYLSGAFISEEMGLRKPDRAFFDYVLKHIGLGDKSRALIIGDSLTADIAGGLNAGIDTCWFNPGGMANKTNSTPTYEIRDLSEVISIAGLTKEVYE